MFDFVQKAGSTVCLVGRAEFNVCAYWVHALRYLDRAGERHPRLCQEAATPS